MSASETPNDFTAVKDRLAEIAEAVGDESLSLDEALDLYEEAVALGLQASDLLETGVEVPEEPASASASAGGDDEGVNAEGAPKASIQEAAEPVVVAFEGDRE